jgi:hypothetical protein
MPVLASQSETLQVNKIIAMYCGVALGLLRKVEYGWSCGWPSTRLACLRDNPRELVSPSKSAVVRLQGGLILHRRCKRSLTRHRPLKSAIPSNPHGQY